MVHPLVGEPVPHPVAAVLLDQPAHLPGIVLGRRPGDGERQRPEVQVEDAAAGVGRDVLDRGREVSGCHRHGTAGRAADRPGLVNVDLDKVGATEVVDGGRVGVAQGVEVDHLDVVEVHDDVANVAGESDTLAVG